MNTLEHEVLEVLIEPHKTNNEEWSVTFMVSCWGTYRKTVTGDEMRVKKFVKGYKWIG